MIIAESVGVEDPAKDTVAGMFSLDLLKLFDASIKALDLAAKRGVRLDIQRLNNVNNWKLEIG